MLLLGYRHGLRPMELVTLRWDAIDLAHGANPRQPGQERRAVRASAQRRRTARPAPAKARAGAALAFRLRIGAGLTLHDCRLAQDGGAAGGGGQARLCDASAHAAACLRLSACQPGDRYLNAASVLRSPQHPAHGTLQRTVANPLQEFVARLTACGTSARGNAIGCGPGRAWRNSATAPIRRCQRCFQISPTLRSDRRYPPGKKRAPCCLPTARGSRQRTAVGTGGTGIRPIPATIKHRLFIRLRPDIKSRGGMSLRDLRIGEGSVRLRSGLCLLRAYRAAEYAFIAPELPRVHNGLLFTARLSVTPMSGSFFTWPALGLAFELLGLFSSSQAFGEGGCLVIEMPVNQQAVPVDPKASAGEASSVHPRAKGKARGRIAQRLTNSTLDDTQLKALILDQSAPAYCGGARIVEGDKSGQYLHPTTVVP